MRNKIKDIIIGITSQSLQTIVTIVVIAALLVYGVRYLIKNSHVEIANDSVAISTPSVVNSIKDVAQWEFLTISDEELVDTIRKSIFGDSELIRIYYGDIRLGFALNDTTAGWCDCHGDTVKAVLPAIRLLDKDFIDEAKTLTFYETGDWKPADMNALYERAKRKMLKRCLTKENIESAKQNAALQMNNIFRAGGYNTIELEFK